MKLAKKWKKENACDFMSESTEDVYTVEDFQIGQKVHVLGREMLIYDCDAFTRHFFKNVLGITLQAAITVVEKQKISSDRRAMPPHDGFGSLEDSLQNTLSFIPRPPRKDVVKQILNANKYLRYEMVMASHQQPPENVGRRFLLFYSLADSTCRIFEPPVRNSGIVGGKYLKATLLVKPNSDPINPEYYSPADFTIGSTVNVFQQQFMITGADFHVYKYMMANPSMFPTDVQDNLRTFMQAKGTKLMVVHPVYTRIVSHFPQDFSFCFAYGSAVKQQLAGARQPMIDLIFCVNNPHEWHQANVQLNRNHYSNLRLLGVPFITRYQRNVGAAVYFNTLVHLNGSLIKYGVVATQDLVRDLLDWSHLYLAGRLQKPVEIIKQPSSVDLQTALQLNLRSALHATLLLAPETFTDYEFYCTLANLSYGGDFRMVFGEDRHKVEHIVRPQLDSFRRLYTPIIQRHLHDYVHFPDTAAADVHCSQDISGMAKLYHLNQLPRWPQTYLTRFWNNKGQLRQDSEDVMRAIAFDPDCNTIVQDCINSIVWQSSVRQSLKTILTAGLFKSLRYSARKIARMSSSLR